MADFRIDLGSVLEAGKPWRSRQGHLRADANVTRAGVLRYYNADGSYRDELRHPDQVFHPKSLSSLAGVPITLGHPVEDGKHVLVTPQNWGRYGKGVVGDRVRNLNPYVRIDGLNIQADDALKALELGNKQLSPGYQVISVPEDGKFDGIAYTHRQYGIRLDGEDEDFIPYNHLAIMDVGQYGRSGELVKVLNLDSGSLWVDSGYDFADEKPKYFTDKRSRQMSQKFINVEGSMYAVDAATGTVTIGEQDLQTMLSLLQQLRSQMAEIQSSETKETEAETPEATPETPLAEPLKKKVGLDSVGAIVDAFEVLKGEKTALEKELSKRVDSGDLLAAVKSRVALIEAAKSHIKGDATEMSERQIKEAVVSTWDASEKLDGLSDAELSGMYRVAIGVLNRSDAGVRQQADEIARSDSTTADAKTGIAAVQANLKKNRMMGANKSAAMQGAK